MDVLQLSKDPAIRRKYKRKTKAMMLWYLGYDLFKEALLQEEVNERDPDADDGSSHASSSRGGSFLCM